MNEKIQHIPLEKIVPSPKNRNVGGFDKEKLEQLADSIRSIGVQQPAIVRPAGDHFELVAGERRWRASSLAGVPTLPCIVRDLDNAAALHIQLIENLQREDIHPLDEAEGFHRLIEEGHYEIEFIAKETGRSAVYVYQRLKLRKLIPAARSLLAGGKISAGHANLIARLPPKQQHEALKILDRPWLVSIKDFDEQIRHEILMELSRAAWKLHDADLLPAAGPCSSCSKRTGAEPQLFAELGKKDCCADKTCFEAKENAFIAKKQAALEGIEHLEVLDGYSEEREAIALAPHEWTECKKSDEGAVRVLVVGGNKPGRLTWGKKRAYVKTQAQKKEERTKEKQIEKARNEYALSLYEGILERFNDVEGLSLPLLRSSLLQVWKNLGFEGMKRIAKLEGWADPDYNNTFLKNHLETLNRGSLERLLLVFAFGIHSKVNQYNRGIDRALIEGATAAGIDAAPLLEKIAGAYGLTADDIDPRGAPGEKDDANDDATEDEATEDENPDDESARDTTPAEATV